jgi:hypothetical protein
VTTDVEKNGDEQTDRRDDRRDMNGQFEVIRVEKETSNLIEIVEIGHRDRLISRERTFRGDEIDVLQNDERQMRLGWPDAQAQKAAK